MQSLDQLIARVAEHKGYTVQGTDAEALFARRGDDTLLCAWKLDGPVTPADAQLFLTAYEQVHATQGILVAPKGLDDAAKAALAAAKGVEAWAESRLMMEVGEALVKDAVNAPHPAAAPAALPPTPPAPQFASPNQPTGSQGARKFPSLIAQAASAASNAGGVYVMPNRHKEAPADMQATLKTERGGQLGYAWGGSAASHGSSGSSGIAQYRNPHATKQVDQWGNAVEPGKAVAAAPAAAATATPTIGGKPAVAAHDEEAYEIITTKKPAKAAVTEAPTNGSGVLKVNLTAQDALAKSGKQGSAKLTLVPHIAFDYDVNVERPELPAPITGKGAVLVSSLTGELRTVDSLAWEPSAPADARKEQEKLQAVDIYDKVKSHMLKTYSKTMQVEKEIAGNTVMANLKISPDPEEMGLQHRGMILCPVWEINTSTGIVKVDAFSGALL